MNSPINTHITLFLDTNSLLHYPALRSINWQKTTECSEVKLILCLQVIHELDEKKDDPRLGGRAKRIIKEIKEVRQNGGKLTEGTHVSVFNYEVRAADFPEALSIDSKDDRIVLSVKKYSESYPLESIAVFTEDMGMSLRCEASGVRVLEPDSQLRLESPQDEQEKKYRLAITELNSLKNRLPRLQLCATNVNGRPLSNEPFSCELNDAWTPIDIEARLAEQKLRVPMMQHSPQLSHPMISADLLGYGISKSDIDKYNRQIANYLMNFQLYLQLLNTWGSNNARSFSFDLWLKNDGNSPSEDIDVSVHFPRQVRWLADVTSDTAKPLERPQPPQPPEKPNPHSLLESTMRDFSAISQITPISEHLERIVAARDADTLNVFRCQDASYAIHAKIGRVKHGQSHRFGRFTAVFGEWSDVHPLEVDWSISAAELPDSLNGRIPFLVRKQEA